MTLSLDGSVSATDIYKVMSQTVIPRPIAWVVTEDDGVTNVAPFSYFIPLASTPPTLLVSVGHKPDGTPKDTLYNLRKHRKCTLCIAEPSMMRPLHYSSKALPHDMSEAEAFGIALERRDNAFPPAVADAPVAYYCTLREEIGLGGPTVPLVLDVKAIWLADRIVEDPQRLSIDFEPLARLGKAYATIGEKFEAPTIP